MHRIQTIDQMIARRAVSRRGFVRAGLAGAAALGTAALAGCSGTTAPAGSSAGSASGLKKITFALDWDAQHQSHRRVRGSRQPTTTRMPAWTSKSFRRPKTVPTRSLPQVRPSLA